MASSDPSLEQSFSVWPSSLSKSIFLGVSGISYILICVCCFFSCYWELLKRAWLHVLCTLPSNICTDWQDASEVSILQPVLQEQPQLSQPMTVVSVTCSPSWHFTRIVPVWCLSHHGWQTLTQYSRSVLPVLSGGRGACQPAGNIFLNIAQKDAGHLCQHPIKFGLTEVRELK